VFPLYRAAEDGGVLMIAILLRFMDSFMIYTEPFVVTGGGPGNSTTFLSIDLVKMALGQFDLGPAAAISLVFPRDPADFCWVFFTVMTNVGSTNRTQGWKTDEPDISHSGKCGFREQAGQSHRHHQCASQQRRFAKPEHQPIGW
jgi:glycerol transport system permease protein